MELEFKVSSNLLSVAYKRVSFTVYHQGEIKNERLEYTNGHIFEMFIHYSAISISSFWTVNFFRTANASFLLWFIKNSVINTTLNHSPLYLASWVDSSGVQKEQVLTFGLWFYSLPPFRSQWTSLCSRFKWVSWQSIILAVVKKTDLKD